MNTQLVSSALPYIWSRGNPLQSIDCAGSPHKNADTIALSFDSLREGVFVFPFACIEIGARHVNIPFPLIGKVMARHEHDREDLMREAVALVDRVELSIAGFEEFITIGFRANSAMSIFIGQDPVYQFDSEGRLRRAFVDGLLYRSQEITLAMLKRERTETETRLLRTDLDVDSLLAFRETMHNSLEVLYQKLDAGQFTTIRNVPEAADHIPRIQTALAVIRDAQPWLSPATNRRR